MKKKQDPPLCVTPPNLILTHQQDQSGNHFSKQERICQVSTMHYVKHGSITYDVSMPNELHKIRAA